MNLADPGGMENGASIRLIRFQGRIAHWTKCISRHFGSYKQSKLRGTQRKGQYSAVKSTQFSWAGQYKCVYSTISSLLKYSAVVSDFSNTLHTVKTLVELESGS